MPPTKKVMALIETPVEVDVNEDGNRALTEALEQMPVVAILTGLQPARAAEVGLALVGAGITILEVPLRGQAEPLVLKAIAALVTAVGDRALIGAGTVLTVEQVANVAATGAKLIVSPNLDPAVVKATKAAGLVSLPGVYTPTEALLAIDAGADGLKLFPTDGSSPRMLKAMCAVLPAQVPMLAVGGVDAGNVATWWAAGAKGFGVGGTLWGPAMPTADVARRAAAFVTAVDAARAGASPPAPPPAARLAAPPLGESTVVVAAAAAVAALVGNEMDEATCAKLDDFAKALATAANTARKRLRESE